MPVVGSFARVDVDAHDQVRERVELLPGVTTFDLGTREKIGLLIETDDLETAHELVNTRIPSVAGVLGVWPVSVHLDEQESGPESGRESHS